MLGRNFRSTIGFLQSAQWWSASQAREYQLQQLRRICKLAFDRAPYYRARFQACGFDPDKLSHPEDLQRIPLITGTVLIYTMIFVMINFTIDVLYATIDPRIRFDK